MQKVTVWYHAARPFTLSASIVPVLVGSALAFSEGHARFGMFVLVLLASVLVQVTTNLVDEYSDHARPERRGKLLAPYKVIALGLLASRQVKMGATACFAVAAAIGLYLVIVSGWPILVMCVASAAAAYFYSAGPKPLGTLGLGQPLVFIFMGPVMVMGAYYVQTHVFTLAALMLSLPVGGMVTAILAANDLRDMEEDKTAGKRTPVTWWGLWFGRWEWTVLVAVAFLMVVTLAVARVTGPFVLISLLAAPDAVGAARVVWGGWERPELAGALRGTSRLHAYFGLLLALGLGLERLLSGLGHAR